MGSCLCNPDTNENPEVVNPRNDQELPKELRKDKNEEQRQKIAQATEQRLKAQANRGRGSNS